MPYGKRKRGGRRGRRSFGKKKYSTTTSKLADKRINTLVEKRMQDISKQEAKKLIAPNLVFRRYLFADYNAATYLITNRSEIDTAGLIVHIAQIPKWDSETNITVPPLADADLRPQVPLYPRGANVVAPTTSKDQYRFGSHVSIKNISCELIFQLMRPPLQVPEMKDVTVQYTIGYWGGDGIFALQSAPQPSAVRSWPRPFGYSSRLDNLQPELEKFRSLKSGFVTLHHSDFNITEKTRNVFWSGNLAYEFDPRDQNGQMVVGNKKLYLVLRSDVPTTYAQKPTVAAVVKLGYRDQ